MIEHDAGAAWCVEVMDSSNRLVAKLANKSQAEELISLAERLDREDKEHSAMIEKMLEDEDESKI